MSKSFWYASRDLLASANVWRREAFFHKRATLDGIRLIAGRGGDREREGREGEREGEKGRGEKSAEWKRGFIQHTMTRPTRHFTNLLPCSVLEQSLPLV